MTYPPADDRLKHLLAQEINPHLDTWKFAFWLADGIVKSPEIRAELQRIADAHVAGQPCGDRHCERCRSEAGRDPAAPACTSDGGCRRVVPCVPGCAATTAAIRTAAGQDQPHDRRERWDAIWLDPFGGLTAVQAEAARRMKAQLRAVADAEQQDLRVRAEQAEELLRVAEQTSNTSEAERARAVQRAESAEAQLAQARGAALTADERQFLTFALDQAAEEMSLNDGFTEDDEAALEKFRRMAAEAQQDNPAAERDFLARVVASITGQTPEQVVSDARRGLERDDTVEEPTS